MSRANDGRGSKRSSDRYRAESWAERERTLLYEGPSDRAVRREEERRSGRTRAYEKMIARAESMAEKVLFKQARNFLKGLKDL